MPNYAVGCKRMIVADSYYEIFNRSNVSLVNLNGSSVESMTASGIVALGRETAVDDIILATGFDAMTGALNAISITGRDGRTLRREWAEGPRTYLGIGAEGFPNFFHITGPQSPSVLTNMSSSIEFHVNWIGDCLQWMGKHGKVTIEPSRSAQEEWVSHCNMIGDMTIVNAGCNNANSWYRGANIPGKPTGMVLPYCGGHVLYAQKCAEVADRGYEGYVLT